MLAVIGFGYICEIQFHHVRLLLSQISSFAELITGAMIPRCLPACHGFAKIIYWPRHEWQVWGAQTLTALRARRVARLFCIPPAGRLAEGPPDLPFTAG